MRKLMDKILLHRKFDWKTHAFCNCQDLCNFLVIAHLLQHEELIEGNCVYGRYGNTIGEESWLCWWMSH